MGCRWNCHVEPVLVSLIFTLTRILHFEKIYAPCTVLPLQYFGPSTEGPSVSKYWHFQNIAFCFPSLKEATTQEKILRIFYFMRFNLSLALLLSSFHTYD